MRRLLFALLLAGCAAAPAQARAFEQPELDALLAPVALYPDELVEHILVAAAYPDQVGDAARGVPAQPHWHPSVAALLPYPELLQRMAESPQWMRDLSEAFIYQQPAVMATVQALRARAQAYGQLPPPQPAAQVVYVRYYDPLVVYGPWWWPAWRPVFWRPWHAHRVFIPRHHHRVVRPHPVAPPPHGHVKPRFPPAHGVHSPKPHIKPHVRVPESHRRPIVTSTPQLSRHFRPQAHRQAAPSLPPRQASHSRGARHDRGGGGPHRKPR